MLVVAVAAAVDTAVMEPVGEVVAAADLDNIRFAADASEGRPSVACCGEASVGLRKDHPEAS